ncbi:MAG: hypothetical protein ACK5QX_10105 [bacterium]|jgi:hypothetical protein
MTIELIVSVISLVFLLFGGLLGIIGYFLREMHRDFKGLRNDVVTIMRSQSTSEEKGKSGFQLLSQRIDDIDARVERIEDKVF